MDHMLDAEELTCASAMRKRSLLSDDFRITESVHTLMHYNFDTVTLLYLTTSITLRSDPFRANEDSATFATTPIRRESGSKRYSSMDCA